MFIIPFYLGCGLYISKNMSWFSQISQLTSKAEALLVKLDQNAAEALHNPEELLRGTKLLDQVISINNIQHNNSDMYREDTEPEPDKSDRAFEQTIEQTTYNDTNIVTAPQVTLYQTDLKLDDETVTPSCDIYSENVVQTIATDNDEPSNHSANNVESTQSLIPTTSRQPRKFTIQTSRTTSRTFMAEKRPNKKDIAREINHTSANGANVKVIDRSLTNLGADDIRASINQSLQEYAVQSTSSFAINNLSNSALGQTTYTSHFDSQPILAQGNLIDSDLTSPSFSIDVPDEKFSIETSADNSIASQLLKQSVFKKKSTFYLHKVINRLASTGGQANAIIGDETRIKFRRAQLRAASYARRLNYYFRAYPMTKYVILIYVVSVQLLIIYVLFFYQSSSSSTDLSSQINKQQQELRRLQPNSDSRNQ